VFEQVVEFAYSEQQFTNTRQGSVLNFSDGISINTDGPYRVIKKIDGYYVVGHGMLFAVDTYEEGLAEVKELKEKAGEEPNENPWRLGQDRTPKSKVEILKQAIDKRHWRLGRLTSYDLETLQEIVSFVTDKIVKKFPELNTVAGKDRVEGYVVGWLRSFVIDLGEWDRCVEFFDVSGFAKEYEYEIAEDEGLHPREWRLGIFKLPKRIWNAIQHIKSLGITNMLSQVNRVKKLLREYGYYEAADWVAKYPTRYTRLIMSGRDVVELT